MCTPGSRLAATTARDGRGRSLVTALLSLVALTTLLAPAGAVRAHDGAEITPENGELVLGTPERIVIAVPGEEEVTVELRRASGEPIAFTGETLRTAGSVRVTPPVLEPGTYVVTWSTPGGRTRTSSFSVGEVDATLSGTAQPGRPLALTAAAFALVLLAAGLAARAVRRGRPGWPYAAAGSVAVVTAVALLLPLEGVGAIAVGVLALAGVTGAALLAAWVLDLRAAAEPADRLRATWPVGVAGTVALSLLVVASVLRALAADLFSTAMLLTILAGVLYLAALLPVLGVLVARARDDRSGGGMAAASLTVLGAVVALLLLAQGAPIEGRVAAVERETRSAASCLTGTNRLSIQRCLDAALVEQARSEGVNRALDTLRGLLALEGRARYFCHEASHAVGRASLRLNGNLADAFRDGYDVCDFGYYHGIVEGAAGGFDDATFLAAVPTLCEEFASAEEIFYMQCNHGIGHAAARRTNNDMIRSLAFCDALSANPNLTGERLRVAENGCGTGVTMEWFATATADVNAAVSPRVSRPREVCTLVPARWAPECVEYVGNTLNASDPVNSLAEIGQWCETTGHATSCYRGVARAAAGVGVGDRDAIGICEMATDRNVRDDCVTYYVATVATTIDFDVAAVDRICRELPEADRNGSRSLCARIREAVVQVLAAGDGKPRS